MTSTGPGAEGGARAPLWNNRDYMLLWSGQVVSTLGSSAASIIYRC